MSLFTLEVWSLLSHVPLSHIHGHMTATCVGGFYCGAGVRYAWWLNPCALCESQQNNVRRNTRSAWGRWSNCLLRQAADEFALTAKLVSLYDQQAAFSFYQAALRLTAGADSHVGHRKNWSLFWLIMQTFLRGMTLSPSHTCKSCAKGAVASERDKWALRANLIHTYTFWPWLLCYLTMARQSWWW